LTFAFIHAWSGQSGSGFFPHAASSFFAEAEAAAVVAAEADAAAEVAPAAAEPDAAAGAEADATGAEDAAGAADAAGALAVVAALAEGAGGASDFVHSNEDETRAMNPTTTRESSMAPELTPMLPKVG
jgi:hypothetical protein